MKTFPKREIAYERVLFFSDGVAAIAITLRAILVFLAITSAVNVFGQTIGKSTQRAVPGDEDPPAIAELGGAINWNIKGFVPSGGPSIAVWAGEAALDLMYWPFKKRRFGFYAEPAYDYSFSVGHEQSISISGGLLISIY